MTNILFLIPLFTILSAFLVYRHNGKFELFKFDLVQFFYAFFIAPVIFLWGKSFLFFVLRNELDFSLGIGDIFFFDTIYSLICLFLFGFVVLHSYTKSINLKVAADPLYDIWNHSEYIHLWLSHLAMYGGGMALLTLLSSINVFFPLEIIMSKSVFYLFLFSSLPAGLIIFMTIWLSDPKQKHRKYFMRIMKLTFAGNFLIHMLWYFVFNPNFSAPHLLYWWSLFVFTVTVICSFFTYRYKEAQNIFDQFGEWFRHKEWEFRAQLKKSK